MDSDGLNPAWIPGSKIDLEILKEIKSLPKLMDSGIGELCSLGNENTESTLLFSFIRTLSHATNALRLRAHLMYFIKKFILGMRIGVAA